MPVALEVDDAGHVAAVVLLGFLSDAALAFAAPFILTARVLNEPPERFEQVFPVKIGQRCERVDGCALWQVAARRRRRIREIFFEPPRFREEIVGALARRVAVGGLVAFPRDRVAVTGELSRAVHDPLHRGLLAALRHEAAAAGLRHDAHDLAVHRVRGALQVAVVVAQELLQLAVEGEGVDAGAGAHIIEML